MDQLYKISLTEQEMLDVLAGVGRLKDHAVNDDAERRFQTLWEKITDVFEERNPTE
jgi:hypothetical protein